MCKINRSRAFERSADLAEVGPELFDVLVV